MIQKIKVAQALGINPITLRRYIKANKVLDSYFNKKNITPGRNIKHSNRKHFFTEKEVQLLEQELGSFRHLLKK